jgi:hypothetical protein
MNCEISGELSHRNVAAAALQGDLASSLLPADFLRILVEHQKQLAGQRGSGPTNCRPHI